MAFLARRRTDRETFLNFLVASVPSLAALTKNIVKIRIKVLGDGMLITAFLNRAETLKSAAKAEGLVTLSGCRRRSDNIEEISKQLLITFWLLGSTDRNDQHKRSTLY